MEKYLITDFAKYRNDESLDMKYGREPVIALMPNGNLICVITTGGPYEPHWDNFVVILRSYDGGKTWSDPQKLFSHKKRGVWATEIYTGFEYPMMVLYTYTGDNPYKELQTFVSYTYDNGETWTEPRTISAYANCLSLRRGFKMSNGETVFPIYHTNMHKDFGDFLPRDDAHFWDLSDHASGVIVTADGGKSYTPYGDFGLHTETPEDGMFYEFDKENPSELWEPNCVELEDGHLVMYMRASKRPYINSAESFDYGRTWSFRGSIDVFSSNTKLTMFKLKDTAFLVTNVNKSIDSRDRTKLQILKSKDCKTWEFVSFVGEENQWIFYPHVAIDEENGKVYLSYEDVRRHYLNVYSFEELGV
jgi:hypothetical protein